LRLSRSTTTQALRRVDRTELGLAAYCAQIVLGAGVLTVTFQTPSVGLVPLVVGFAVMAALAVRLYSRVAAAQMPATDSGSSLGSAVAACGTGQAGRRLATFGMVTYCLGASIGYACLAQTALASLLAEATGLGWLRLPALAAAFVVVCVLRLTVRAGQTLLTLAAAWLPGLALAGEFPQAQSGLLLVSFGAGVILLRLPHRGIWRGRNGQTRTATQAAATGVGAAHLAAINTMRAQSLLMGGLATAALVVLVLKTGSLRLPTLMPQGLTGARLVEAVGVLIFAMVGCGWSNVSAYPAMCDDASRRRVISASMRLVLIVIIGWLVVTGLALSSEQLATLDQNRSFTTAGLADVVRTHTSAGLVAVIIADVALLLAVSGASSGFLEGLATEVSDHRCSVTGRLYFGVNQLVIVLTAFTAAAAYGVQLLGLTTSQVLAAAGTVGGGVVLFILPLLCEPRPRRRPLMAAVAIVAAVGAMTMGCYAAFTGDATFVLRLLNLTMAVAVIPLTVRAARSAAATARRSTSHVLRRRPGRHRHGSAARSSAAVAATRPRASASTS
jgi:hypothetical protein